MELSIWGTQKHSYNQELSGLFSLNNYLAKMGNTTLIQSTITKLVNKGEKFPSIDYLYY